MSPPPFRPRQFLAAEIDLSDTRALAPVFQRLEEGLMRARSVAQLEAWIAEQDEVDAATGEIATQAYIAMTRQTDDPERERRYLHIIEEVEPWLKPRRFALHQQLVAHPYFPELPSPHYDVFRRSIENQVRLYRPENVARETDEARLAQQYAKRCGAMTVVFDGREQTLAEVGRVLEEADRGRRQAAFAAIAARWEQEREPMEDIFDQLLLLRGEIARSAGFSDYRAYAFAHYERFDYTPEDCLQFHDAIEREVVPLRRALQEDRRQRLGLPVLRPWDLDADPDGKPPLRPFAGGHELAARARELFAGLDSRMESGFALLERDGLLDLDSRKGKAPGGYQQTLEEARVPFIFMNATGTQADVETLLHEAGHAFHALAAREQSPAAYREPPIEFAEVASMGMELLAAPRLETFYAAAPGEAVRARREHLENLLNLLPWVAVVDAFQHWLYTHPGHSRDERATHWLELVSRFGGIEDWSGLEPVRRFHWQRQLHFFEVPFYYVEYGIAQLGALQLWRHARVDSARAIDDYFRALRLGGSRPLPELFAAAGLRFDFSTATLRPLLDAVRAALSA